MKNLYRASLCLALLLGALPAWSLSCSIGSNPLEVKVIYTYFTTITAQGTINVACTRDPNVDPRRPWFWYGMTQTTAGRTATLDTGGSTIGYEIFHGSATQGTWTGTGAGVAAGSTTDGPILDRADFGGGGGSNYSDAFTFWLRVPAFQFRPAGVYLDSVPITMRRDTAAGAVVTTGTLNVYISIPRSCRFSTPPTPISVNYTAFSPVPVTGASNFALTCTQGTTYTLALDQPRSVIPGVELAYGLSLSAASSTGTAAAQGYTVNISVDAGQAGRCSTSTCSGTDTRTLTITY
jgi:spore coat protein U-like protein